MNKKSLNDFVYFSLPKELESGYLLTSFQVKELKNTKITIYGLGFFCLYINGQLVSDEINSPFNYSLKEDRVFIKVVKNKKDIKEIITELSF